MENQKNLKEFESMFNNLIEYPDTASQMASLKIEHFKHKKEILAKLGVIENDKNEDDIMELISWNYYSWITDFIEYSFERMVATQEENNNLKEKLENIRRELI